MRQRSSSSARSPKRRVPLVLTRGGIVLFIVAAPLIYAVLAIPWPGLTGSYATAYQVTATALFGNFGGGRATFAAPGELERLDTVISVRHPPSKVVGARGHSSRLIGYLPTALGVALLAALLCAAPKSWRRLLPSVVWTLLWLHLFIALRVVVGLTQFYSLDAPWKLFETGPWTRRIIDIAYQTLAFSPTASFVVPIAIWAAVCLRREDLAALQSLIRGGEDARDPSTPHAAIASTGATTAKARPHGGDATQRVRQPRAPTARDRTNGR